MSQRDPNSPVPPLADVLGELAEWSQPKHITLDGPINAEEIKATNVVSGLQINIYKERSSSVFQTVEQFYQPLLNPDRLFHHMLPLIGRVSDLKTLIEFSGSQKQVALLYGPDGIGKSRLLLEALRQTEKEHKALKVFVPRLTYTAANEYELEEGQILIAVDNVLGEDINNLDELFRSIRSYPDRVKLILAVRQEDLYEVKQHLFSANFQPEEILAVPLLHGIENPLELARAILGREDLHSISQLVTLASDSPLIMVIAGELLKRGRINHSILALSHDEFREKVIFCYEQLHFSNTPFPISESKVKKVRELLCAIGTFDTKNVSLVTKAATFLQITTDEFLETLDLLVGVGKAICRGNSYSSISNALAYLILEQACFTKGGIVMTFGSSIALAFTEPWQTNTLRRLAEVNWLKGKGRETGLLASFWQEQNKRFCSGPLEECIDILRIIDDVAGLQPKVALDFVQLALQLSNAPSLNTRNDQSSSEQIKHYLPSILEQIAQHIEFTKVAINLLWNLGKGNFSDMPRSTSHPHQILQKLAKQRYGRSVTYYNAYLQCIETWCGEVDAFDQSFTPLDLIPSFLTRDGYEDYYFPQTQSIHMQPFYVLPEPMKAIRKQAIRLFAAIGQMNEKPKFQYHVTEVLCNIIIRGLLYNNAPELRAQWYEEDREILKEISDIAQKARSAFLTYSIEYKLRTALKHPENAPLAEDLHSTLTTLPLDLDTEIMWYLMHRQSAKQFSKEAINEYEGRNDAVIREVAVGFLQTYPTVHSLKKKLDSLYSHLALYAQQILYPYFFELLTEIDPVLGYGLCRLLVDDPSSHAVDCFTYLVVPVRKWNITAFLDLIRDAMKSDNPRLRRGAAYAICACTDFTDEECSILITLIKDVDSIIAMRAIYAIRNLPENMQDKAFFTLDEISITSQDEQKIDAICEALCQRMNNLTWDPIPFMTSFLQKCVALPKLSIQKHYGLCSFLLKYRWEYPQIVAHFCLDRVKHRRLLPDEQQQWYESVSWISSPLVPEDRPVDKQHVEERYQALCTIRDEFLKFEESEVRSIFAYLAHGYDAIALKAISEWLESNEEQKICAVAQLMSEAPNTFVFDNEDFVERLLSAADQINKDVSKQMMAALLSSAMPFAFFGVPDLSANERIQTRDRALKIANKYLSGSIMHTFYMDLCRKAEERIEMQRSFLAAQ